MSTFLLVSKGVPQGSILGPVLFTLYINDILSALSDCLAHLYADDTIIYCIAVSVELAIERLQLAFDTIQAALANLKLVLNTDKTKFMVFTRARKDDTVQQDIFTKNKSIIERVSEYKYLGIWLDDKLTFKYHIDVLTSKLRQKIGFLYRNGSSFPRFCRKKVVEAVFLSVLDYGDIIYGNAAATDLVPLNSVYHSAIRFITGDDYSTHHCTLYDRVGWTSLEVRRKRHWHFFLFRTLTGKQPQYLSSMLQYSNKPYSTRSSDWLTLHIPYMYSDLGKAAFSALAPSSWNRLQDSLRLKALPSYGHFKSLIDKHVATVCNCFKRN